MPEKPDLPEDGSNFDSQQTQPNLPPEVEDAGATRLQSPQDRTRNMLPVKDARLVSPEAPRRPPARTSQPYVPPPPPEKLKRGQPQPGYAGDYTRPYPPPRRANPLSLPIWSVFLMLFMVCGAVSCVVVAVLGLGGRNAPALAPQFLVITAAPTETVQITLPSLIITATSPLELSAPQAGAPPVVLSGPTLAPVVISPTPESIGIGKTVVVNSQESGLNVRSAPGVTTGSSILFVADDGTQLTVVDGPAQADGYTWWKLQDPTDPTKVGWGAAVFLEIVSAATPTL